MAELERIDSLINKSKHGGKRTGAGRKQGSKNKKTLEKEKVKEQLEQRVMTNVNKLVNAQFDLATGEKYLMVTRTIGKGSKQRRETEIITDSEIIKRYLDEDLESSDDEFYFMTTKPANNQALQGLLDRVFGKAPQGIDFTGEQKLIIETRKGSGSRKKD